MATVEQMSMSQSNGCAKREKSGFSSLRFVDSWTSFCGRNGTIRALSAPFLIFCLVASLCVVGAARTYHSKATPSLESREQFTGPSFQVSQGPVSKKLGPLSPPSGVAGKARTTGRRGGLRGGMPFASMSDLKGREGDDNNSIPASAMEGPVDGEKLSKWFMGLYHEKQIGGLCAVHCLNNLMQGTAFDEIELAEIAHDMDRRERETLGGAGLDAESGNVRADGFFSVQVIQQALQSKGLQCMPVGSSEAKEAQLNPVKEVGFICNRSEHWFALRRVGPYWFDVNSTLKQPRFISDTYLAMTLSQSKQDGYSVFVVRGRFPPCDLERATDRKRLDAVAAACKEGVSGQVSSSPSAPAVSAFSGAGYSLAGPSTASSSSATADRPGLAEALAAAGVDANADPELAAAIAASLGDASSTPAAAPALDSAEEMRRKRLARFG